MLQLYPEAGHAHAAAAGGNGGSVRQFFAQRRALQASGGSGGGGAASLNGLQQSLNGSWSSGTFARHPPKHGSPVGWDKSYPLSPLDRDARDSGPYLGSFSTKNGLDRSRPKPAPPPPAAAPNRRRLEAPAARKPGRRAPSLDRRNAAGPVADAGMRRSNSQILAAPSTHHRDKENEPRAPLAAKTPQRSQNKSEAAKVANGPRRLRPAATSPTAATKAPGPTEDLRDGGAPRAVSPPKAKKPPVPAISYHSPPKPSSPATPKQAGRTPPPRRPSTAADPNLTECPFCERHFALDRIDKHKDICQKTATKKRKVFDPTKMRMKGTDLEEFARKSAKSGHRSPDPPSPKKGDWRQKRNAFIETIRQAKAVQRHVAAGGKASDLPPPPPMDTSDYVRCPHCGRKFSEAAAERHIPKCKNIKSNKKAAY